MDFDLLFDEPYIGAVSASTCTLEGIKSLCTHVIGSLGAVTSGAVTVS